MANAAIVKIVGEPWLSRAKAYREEYMAFVRAWTEFGKSVGATGVGGAFAGGRPSLFFEKETPPAGWTKRDNKSRSCPKKGTQALADYNAMPAKPFTDAIFGDRVMTDLSYDMPCGGYGSGIIGGIFEAANIGWYGDTIIAIIPHAGRAAAEHLARHPDHTVRHGAAEWTLPEGVEEITKSELDLISAQHRVAQERSAA